VPKIADMLANFPSRTEQECYDLSLQRETRNQSVRGISSSPSLEKKINKPLLTSGINTSLIRTSPSVTTTSLTSSMIGSPLIKHNSHM